MFSCCRCTNPKKDKKNSSPTRRDDKQRDAESEEKEDIGKEKDSASPSTDVIEVRFVVEGDKTTKNTAPATKSPLTTPEPTPKAIDIQGVSESEKCENGKNDDSEVVSDNRDKEVKSDSVVTKNDLDVTNPNETNVKSSDKIRSKSDSSNSTIEESIVVQEKQFSKDISKNDDAGVDADNDSSDVTNSHNRFNVPISDLRTKYRQSKMHYSSMIETSRTTWDSSGGGNGGGEFQPRSCLVRRCSSRSSIRKKVNINDSTEVIPSSELASIEDDDEVFSDAIPAKAPRGDMCAPYNLTKRGSIPAIMGLPEWFNEDRFYSEYGGSLEPPVTPVGRDELALKRHRMFSELLMAAHAAVEQRKQMDVNVAEDIAEQDEETEEDCDPDLKPSATAELEKLVNRLEKLVDRLERSVSARELEIANRTFDSVIENKRRRSFDLENAELPPIPDNSAQKQLEKVSENLDKRIDKLESCLNNINEHFKKETPSCSIDNIPTVLDEYLIADARSKSSSSKSLENMSVAGYQDIVNGPLAQYLELSNKIGGLVAQQAQFVKAAFEAQLQYVTLATQIAAPPQAQQSQLLQPTSNEISRIQDFREKNRASPLFNHLSVISESIPALGWVCVAPTPGPHVKEMNDAGQFYSNRVLKEWKDKDPTHVEWARAWIQTLTDLQKYIKQWHTTGLVWSGKGKATAPPPPPPSGCPPPPPPPVMALGDMSLGADDRSALFAEINQGEGITRNLKKVTADMQTHKNPTLRTGPAPFKAPQPFGSQSNAAATPAVKKSAVFTRDGKKWLIEHQKNNRELLVENAEMNNVVYMFKCEDSLLTVKGKINSVVMDSCKKCSILFDSVVSSVEFVNCQSVYMQVLNKVPTISIDKTDGCQIYLSKDSLDVEIISSKSSEMNVIIPKENGAYVEQPIPEQYKTTIQNNSLKTICVENLF